MKLRFEDKALTGTLVVLPEHEQRFEDDMKTFNFSESKSLKLKKVMGYDKHRLVKGPVTVSDLSVFGFRHLFEQGHVEPGEIDALILVTQSPDFFVPATSNIIQGELGLKQDCICLDINQGCAGHIIGLIQAFMFLDQPEIETVAVVVGDVISRKVCRKDRNSFPLTGDGVSISIVKNRAGAGSIHGWMKMDGGRAMALNIPAGGFRQPSSPGTAELQDVGDGNLRAKDHLCMDGAAVFNFVMQEVPPMVEEVLRQAGVTADEVDGFMFHQPNRFMLEKLADKLGVAREKMPNNVVELFGNNSGVTIPTAYVQNMGDTLLETEQLICKAGFGVGLTWCALVMKLGPLEFCERIDFPEPESETETPS